MTSFQVDSDAVQSTASTARGTIARVQADVGDLNAQLTSLEGFWTGQASTAFQGAFAEWRGMHQQLEESLTLLNQALSVAGQQYAETEQANTRLFVR
ncbi:WXG100 family type VII secretion target [Cryobacterium suzukii]|uniref:ESAT-6-like protein n=1 Tax=Cryobacterium suzukii TaxID=1259198 RepID=A0A4V3ISQ7_9MICO|nr:WXG100 family type VII secretion target [Cryobacterium suzukii]TFD61452.1 WXG100 family type VII secretion target [Cryobacterium suzukii]